MIELGIYMVFAILVIIVYLMLNVSIDVYMIYVLVAMFFIQTFKGGDDNA